MAQPTFLTLWDDERFVTNKANAAGTGRGEIEMTEEPRSLASQELFDGRDEVVIIHNGARYRLRITRQDKLILTK
jgi:hemin uptake protein HemP